MRTLLLLLPLSITLFASLHLPSTSQVVYNVMDFGAQSDGTTDSADSFATAWSNACQSSAPSIFYVPNGTFVLGQASFQGPCNNNHIVFRNDGTLIAHPESDGSSEDWIAFDRVEGVLIIGGAIDGQGQDVWNCKLSQDYGECPNGVKSLTITHSRNVTISSLTSTNSKLFHIFINDCQEVRIDGVRLIAPASSPNTDGIHTMISKNISIKNCEIRTGDDCISVGHGTIDLRIKNITCGPGHGISIGSLGEELEEQGVQNITVSEVLFQGTQNGLRIKTWGRPSYGFVDGVIFEHIKMFSVENPIIIDQNYCPHNINCPNMESGVQISGVEYNNIEGSSTKTIAVQFNCSRSNPCREINLEEVNLNYQNESAQSYCSNAEVFTSGLVNPPTCPAN